MSFSYLYILQRQWNRDVNSILNSAKETNKQNKQKNPLHILMKLCARTPVWADHFTAQFVLPTQRCRLLSIFLKPSSPATSTDLACCTWLKTSMPTERMDGIFLLIIDICGNIGTEIFESGLSQAPSCLSGTAPAGKLWSNIQMRLQEWIYSPITPGAC